MTSTQCSAIPQFRVFSACMKLRTRMRSSCDKGVLLTACISVQGLPYWLCARQTHRREEVQLRAPQTEEGQFETEAPDKESSSDSLCHSEFIETGKIQQFTARILFAVLRNCSCVAKATNLPCFAGAGAARPGSEGGQGLVSDWSVLERWVAGRSGRRLAHL